MPPMLKAKTGYHIPNGGKSKTLRANGIHPNGESQFHANHGRPGKQKHIRDGQADTPGQVGAGEPLGPRRLKLARAAAHEGTATRQAQPAAAERKRNVNDCFYLKVTNPSNTAATSHARARAHKHTHTRARTRARTRTPWEVLETYHLQSGSLVKHKCAAPCVKNDHTGSVARDELNRWGENVTIETQP